MRGRFPVPHTSPLRAVTPDRGRGGVPRSPVEGRAPLPSRRDSGRMWAMPVGDAPSMTAVSYRFRAELRTRWRAWLALALLVGLAGGAVLALAAGARRTDTAYSRFLSAQNAYDALVINNRTAQGGTA